MSTACSCVNELVNHPYNFILGPQKHGVESFEREFRQEAKQVFPETSNFPSHLTGPRNRYCSYMLLFQIKAKQEAARRAGGKLLLEKLRPESPISKTRLQKKISMKKIREGFVMKKALSSSFEPVQIVESEEMERQHQLKQREFLVRSYGLIEQVCRIHFLRSY